MTNEQTLHTILNLYDPVGVGSSNNEAMGSEYYADAVEILERFSRTRKIQISFLYILCNVLEENYGITFDETSDYQNDALTRIMKQVEKMGIYETN
jgi:hypothetical protein